ncbi:MAG: DUF294 nucleotidyltransferase-like domain-containing protein, partial [Hyphomicrobiales bacterium]
VSAYEEALDRARMIAHELMFRIGVAIITRSSGRAQAGQAYSTLADELTENLLAHVLREMETAHGKVFGSACAVLALGKLGSEEMTASSDLDIMVVYEVPGDAAGSDGAKSLSASQYFARATQRLIAALSAPTAEGLLYEVDMRLRPSGNKGPIAVALPSIVAYHESSAWTWERLALCRARVIAGDKELAAKIDDTVRSILTKPRDESEIRADVLAMRKRMIDELYKGDAWDLKQSPGGLVEVEFIVQFLQLLNGRENPAILAQNTGIALEKLGEAGLLAPVQLAQLKSAHDLYHALTQVLRLCVEGEFLLETASGDLVRLLTNAADVPDVPTLEALLTETKENVRGFFCELIGNPEEEPA